MPETWTLRDSWPDQPAPDREDWGVFRNGVLVGRVFRQRLSGGREVYAWFLNKLFPINVNVQGNCDTREEATTAFKRSWERAVDQHGIEKVEAALSPNGWHAYQKAQCGSD
jgi:hypothetical protein